MKNRIIAKIKITEYEDEGKLRYLAEIENKVIKISFNESTIGKLLSEISKELKGVGSLYFN